MEDTLGAETIVQFDYLQLWECDKGTSSVRSNGELADGSGSYKEAHWNLTPHTEMNG